MAIKFDYKKARNDGLSDEQIFQHLEQQKKGGVDIYLDQREVEGYKKPNVVSEFGKGVAKGAVSTVTGLSSLGERLFGRPLENIMFGDNKVLPRNAKNDTTTAERITPEWMRTPTNTAQTAGFVTEQIGEFFIPGAASTKVGKAASVLGKTQKSAKLINLGTRALTEAAVVGGQTSAQQGKIDSQSAKSAGIAAAVPVVGFGLSSLRGALRNNAGRVVNSLIKPGKGQFSYGKNPGQQIAKEGIVANNFDDFIEKVSAKKEEAGRELGKLLEAPQNAGKVIDASKTIGHLDDAIKKAEMAPNTNAALISRLNGMKEDLLGVTTTKSGEKVIGRDFSNLSVMEAQKLKQLIGSITKWTGNASDDKLANKALKRMYSEIDDMIDTAVPGVAQANSRWSNLDGALTAIRNRADVEQRANLIRLVPEIAGIGTGLAFALSGDEKSSAAIKGLLAVSLLEGARTPAVKTRIAALLAKQGPGKVSKAIPGASTLGKRVFGEDVPFKKNIIPISKANKKIADNYVRILNDMVERAHGQSIGTPLNVSDLDPSKLPKLNHQATIEVMKRLNAMFSPEVQAKLNEHLKDIIK